MGQYSVILLAEYLCWQNITVTVLFTWQVTELKPETFKIYYFFLDPL